MLQLAGSRPRPDRQILLDGQRWKDPSALGRHRYAHSNDCVRRETPDRRAIEENGFRRRTKQSSDRPQQRRLTRSVGSDNCDWFPRKQP